MTEYYYYGGIIFMVSGAFIFFCLQMVFFQWKKKLKEKFKEEYGIKEGGKYE